MTGTDMTRPSVMKLGMLMYNVGPISGCYPDCEVRRGSIGTASKHFEYHTGDESGPSPRSAPETRQSSAA
jgi:hypothetical protein